MMKSFYIVPERVKEDINYYKVEVERFLRGDITRDKLKAFRVPHGIYEQRTADTFMARIRIPAGGVTPLQMETIASLSKEYGSGIVHVTTRQDIQIHSVKLTDTVSILEKLLEVDLACRGGGGNTVRNITACPCTGICQEEVFDVSPHAIALTEYLVSLPTSYTLPRKYKIAFSGCSRDCAFATVNDLGFIACRQMVEGKLVDGFRVYAAGGMGACSRVADHLEEFIPAGDILYVAEAMKRFFDKYGNRKNKHIARLRFLREKLGEERFCTLYEEEKKNLRDAGELKPIFHLLPGKEEEIVKEGPFPESIRDDQFQEWLASNVDRQKQEDYFSVKIRLLLGDITAETLVELSRVVSGHGERTIRTTQDQNLIIRWVHVRKLHPLYTALRELGLTKPNAGAMADIVCCTGAANCRLGICFSRGLAEALTGVIEENGISMSGDEGLRIRISGCPNACGHHPISPIAFHGMARRINGRIAPFYEVLLGGRVEEGKTKLAEGLGAVPAKSVPPLLTEFLRVYQKKKGEGESFYQFIDGRGRELMKELVGKFASPSSSDDSFYYDWGAKEEFSLAGRGPGECGAGVLNLIEVDLGDADREIYLADKARRQGEDTDSLFEHLYRATTLAAKALLVTRGLEAKTDKEAFCCFKEEFVQKGLVDSEYIYILNLAVDVEKESVPKESFISQFEQVKQLVTDVNQLYQSMDASLKFNVGKEIVQSQPVTSEKESEKLLDLRGVPCPLNYVKAKLALEEMAVGDILELYLDEGEPMQNVPSSMENDGQTILVTEKRDSYYYLRVKKETE